MGLLVFTLRDVGGRGFRDIVSALAVVEWHRESKVGEEGMHEGMKGFEGRRKGYIGRRVAGQGPWLVSRAPSEEGLGWRVDEHKAGTVDNGKSNVVVMRKPFKLVCCRQSRAAWLLRGGQQ